MFVTVFVIYLCVYASVVRLGCVCVCLCLHVHVVYNRNIHQAHIVAVVCRIIINWINKEKKRQKPKLSNAFIPPNFQLIYICLSKISLCQIAYNAQCLKKEQDRQISAIFIMRYIET